MSARRCELLVVGGGPAGLATALAARRAGIAEVLVLDRGRPPRDKACGEGLMPDGVALASELGVDLSDCGAPFRGIRYLDGERVAEGRFPGGRYGLGVRRPVLHGALVAAARQAGVEIEWGTAVCGLLPGGVQIVRDRAAGRIESRWIVAADGLDSPLRRWAGLARPAGRWFQGGGTDRRRFGVRRHYRLAPWSDLVEVYWERGVEAYVTPVGRDQVGVALLAGEREMRPGAEEPRAGEPDGAGRRNAPFDRLLARFPALADRLRGAAPASGDRGSGPLARRVRGVVRGRLALVGDAAGYVDAITGEGLALAFHQARAVAAAIAAGDLARYAAAHRQLVRLPDGLTRLLLAVERRPALRRRLIAALAAEPELFDRLLGVHCRALPLSEVGLEGALRLAWRLAET